jgi:hypothetical protein
VQHRSPSGEEQPSWRAELIIQKELDPADIEQPTSRAELTLKIEPYTRWEEL